MSAGGGYKAGVVTSGGRKSPEGENCSKLPFKTRNFL